MKLNPDASHLLKDVSPEMITIWVVVWESMDTEGTGTGGTEECIGWW